MPLPKKCEHCHKIYQCRTDKISYSRFCSKPCQHVVAGRMSGITKHNKWNSESKEETYMNLRKSFETFFEKTIDGSCWLWSFKNGKKSFDYGNFSFRGKKYKSNRVAWIVYRGEIPKGLYVLHTCDVRYCVNPDHLFLGTHADNMKDMALKKRAKPRTKLTPDQVLDIAKALDLGATTVQLAKEYNVTSTCIWYIKHKRCWKDII